MTVTTINFCRSFGSEANSGPSTDGNSAGVCNLVDALAMFIQDSFKCDKYTSSWILRVVVMLTTASLRVTILP
jgi:hypothetical protein